MRLIIALLFIVILLPVASARFQVETDINPKAVSEITVEIIQEGVLETEGFIQSANLTLYIPQEGIVSQNVEGDGQFSYSPVKDIYGNDQLLLEWEKPEGIINYKVTTIVNNKAKKFSIGKKVCDTQCTFSQLSLDATESIVIDDNIRKFAFPYDKSWQRIAEMTAEVYNLINYDISLVGARKSSTWALENKKGVCVEHANLLTAMLRSASIPTRYVTGYAYSVVDDRLIGHTWVEVLADDGSWIPFDPTWLEGAYLDATHIKTASLPDDRQIDLLTYYGAGSMTWKRGTAEVSTGTVLGDLYADTINILDIKSDNITRIILTGSDPIAFNGAGFLRAEIFSDICAINDLRVSSCVDASGKEVFNIKNKHQVVFTCGSGSTSFSDEAIWFLEEDSSGFNPYTCPVTVFDQINAETSYTFSVKGTTDNKEIFILGPNIVGVNEPFVLQSSEDFGFIFYSPIFGRSASQNWSLQINKPGTYNFSLYAEDELATKTITVVNEKEFEVSINTPKNITAGESFIVGVTIKNLLSRRAVKLELSAEGQYEAELDLRKNEEKTLQFNISLQNSGTRPISASAISNFITSTTSSIEVVSIDPPSSLLSKDSPFSFIQDFLNAIRDFFSKIF